MISEKKDLLLGSSGSSNTKNKQKKIFFFKEQFVEYSGLDKALAETTIHKLPKSELEMTGYCRTEKHLSDYKNITFPESFLRGMT